MATRIYPKITFQTPREQIIATGVYDESEEMGWIGAVIGAGTGILQSLLGGLFKPCGGANVACGLQGITDFGNKAISTLQQILQMTQAGQIAPQDAVANAQRIAAALGDGSIVYQAKKGKDAAALQNFKSQANALVSQIQSVAATVQQQMAAQSAGAGAGLGASAGISTTTLLLVGGGVLAALLLTGKKSG